MGAVIESIGTCIPEEPGGSHSSVEIAGRAARDALEQCGRRPEEVGLVVNTGIYRDQNICEPAMAPLIQRDHLRSSGSTDADIFGTFSFDLGNGGCGLVNAFQVVDAFLRSGAIRLGLVATSDADPTPDASVGYCFDPCGAAFVLRAGEPHEGFTAFHFETFSKHSDLFEGRIEWTPAHDAEDSAPSQPRISIREGDEYLIRCVECAAAAVGRFLEQRALDLKDVGLLVASSSPAGFDAGIAVALGVSGGRLAAGRARAHTAGPALALKSALGDGHPGGAGNVLFVTVGAGISVSLALYEPSRLGQPVA